MSIISIEGSIGAGKTTFLRNIERAGYTVMYEPVDSWSSEMIHGSSMFELYYKDKNKYGFAFQMLALQSRVQHLIDTINHNPTKIIITERCPLTDYKVFAEMMYEQGIINDYSFRVYKKWYDFTKSILPPVAGIVYLRVTPDVCVQRILKRNRNGEERIDLNYLKALHDKHEQWLQHYTEVPTLILNGNGEVPDVSALTAFIGQLCSFT